MLGRGGRTQRILRALPAQHIAEARLPHMLDGDGARGRVGWWLSNRGDSCRWMGAIRHRGVLALSAAGLSPHPWIHDPAPQSNPLPPSLPPPR
jgi:hypothetical protein